MASKPKNSIYQTMNSRSPDSQEPATTLLLRYLPLALSVGIVGAAAAAYYLVPAFQQFSREAWLVLTSSDEARIARWIGRFDYWGPLLLLVLFILQMLAFVLPSWLLILVCILAYGPVWGSALALAGIVLASSVAYFVGRLLGEHTLLVLLGEKAERSMQGYLERYGLGTVVVFRLAPFLSNDTISFVAGLTGMNIWRFLAGTVLGISPLIGLLAYLGSDIQRLQQGLIWFSGLCIVGFGLYVWYDKRRSQRPD
jgi:uncharacterized membrane protein YdjX (TVP38/TMEM64 family)